MSHTEYFRRRLPGAFMVSK
nr:unnamed protein product [Callosobruchus analis]